MVQNLGGGSTTLSVGGPTMTVESSAALSYGSEGVVMQYAGGRTSKITADKSKPVATAAGVITVAGVNVVLSYAPSGVAVQGPGGAITSGLEYGVELRFCGYGGTISWGRSLDDCTWGD